MKNIQAFLKFAGSLTPEQFAEFINLIGFRVDGDPTKTADPCDADPEIGVKCAGCGGRLFEVGDVVALACGGPGMTISAIDDTHATVMWFDDDDLCERRVPLAVLEHAQPADDVE